jgi:hypothetical protein
MAAVIIFFTVFFFLLGLLAPSLLCRTGIRRPQSALLGAGIVLGGLEILLIAPPRKPRHAGSASPANIPGSSPIGHGCTVPGGQDDKSPVTRICRGPDYAESMVVAPGQRARGGVGLRHNLSGRLD